MGKKDERNVLQNLFVNAITGKSVLFVLLFIFATSWLGNVIYDYSKDYFGNTKAYGIFALITIVILILLFAYYRNLKRKFSPDDAIDINSVDKWGFKVLVIFLSEYKKEIPNNLSADNAEEWLRDGWNSWLMPYLSILRYKTTLDKIYIITSKESSPQLSKFEEIIKPIVANNSISLSEQKVKDINDIDEYTSIFNTIYKESQDYAEDNIVIDVTSGTKLYSIAGSYFALSSEKIVQYIDTNDTNKPPYRFNNKVLSLE